MEQKPNLCANNNKQRLHVVTSIKQAMSEVDDEELGLEYTLLLVALCIAVLVTVPSCCSLLVSRRKDKEH